MYLTPKTALPPFLPLPKFLLTMELSINAKLLYGLLLNRAMLSQKNQWVDERGRVYIIYTVRQMAEDLDRSTRTIYTALTELEQNGLIRRFRRGLSQANLLYVLLPEDEQEPAGVTCKNCRSEVKKSAGHDLQNLQTSNTDSEYTDSNQTEGVESTPSRFGSYDNVILSRIQREKLRREFPSQLDDYVERLSCYLEQSGKTYRSHEAVLRRWMLEDCRKHAGREETYEEGECL